MYALIGATPFFKDLSCIDKPWSPILSWSISKWSLRSFQCVVCRVHKEMVIYSFLQECKTEEEPPKAQDVNTQSLSRASTSKHTISALMQFLLSQNLFIMSMQQTRTKLWCNCCKSGLVDLKSDIGLTDFMLLVHHSWGPWSINARNDHNREVHWRGRLHHY